ncbi:MAG: tyrosine-protein phosphatase [Chlamydiales bacterium]|nr:tyrosine-protein phosphatase [Chlamydiales bacterium]
MINTLKHVWKAPTYTIIIILGMLCGTIEVIVFFIRQFLFKNYLPNYDAVEDSKLYRGGQPSDIGIAQLASEGIKTIIILRTDCNMDRVVEKSKGIITPVHIPFNPYRPNLDMLKQFLMIMKQQKNLPVYIHCFHGSDRTGMFCAIYRIIFHGWNKEKAIKEMKEYGAHWWHYNLIRFIKNIDVEALKEELNTLD